jgi:hypothetical protein
MAKYIPKRITYVCAKSEICEEYFDDTEILISKIRITPAWPIETGKSLDAAIKWAGGDRIAKIIDVENNPITNVKIVGLEERGNGGRAYKVVIDDKYFVDLREDVVLDVIFNCGIEKGGLLNGTFIWVKDSSAMRLIRYDSTIYNEYLAGTEKIASFVELKPTDIIPGGVYETKGGRRNLYLGLFQIYNFHEKVKGNGYGKEERTHREYVKTPMHVYLDLQNYIKFNFKTEGIKRIFSKIDYSPYSILFRNSKIKFVLKVAQIDFKNINIADLIRECGERYHDGKDSNPWPHNYQHACLSIVESGEPIMHDIVKKFNIKVVDTFYSEDANDNKKSPFDKIP